jgi:hypothetical protein
MMTMTNHHHHLERVVFVFLLGIVLISGKQAVEHLEEIHRAHHRLQATNHRRHHRVQVLLQ